jgi:hypothetical protein
LPNIQTRHHRSQARQERPPRDFNSDLTWAGYKVAFTRSHPAAIAWEPPRCRSGR